MGHIAHWDEAPQWTREVGDIASTWTLLGEAAGSVDVGLRRIQAKPGHRTTAYHVHGAEEEVFYVLEGSGTLVQGETSWKVGAGDTILHLAGTDPHCLLAGDEGLSVLVFGTRVPLAIAYLPRAGAAFAGPTTIAAPGREDLWARETESGPLAVPDPSPTPPANLLRMADSPVKRIERGSTKLDYRGLIRVIEKKLDPREMRRAGGTLRTGLNHITLLPEGFSWPAHCHSAEEELFVVLEGSGACILGEEEHDVRAGHVISRPAGTRIAHRFRAGTDGLTLLAYGTRQPNDIAYYPNSGKVSLRGVGVIGRLSPVDYWDGEE